MIEQYYIRPYPECRERLTGPRTPFRRHLSRWQAKRRAWARPANGPLPVLGAVLPPVSGPYRACERVRFGQRPAASPRTCRGGDRARASRVRPAVWRECTLLPPLPAPPSARGRLVIQVFLPVTRFPSFMASTRRPETCLEPVAWVARSRRECPSPCCPISDWTQTARAAPACGRAARALPLF